jgi:hypothetical protein
MISRIILSSPRARISPFDRLALRLDDLAHLGRLVDTRWRGRRFAMKAPSLPEIVLDGRHIRQVATEVVKLGPSATRFEQAGQWAPRGLGPVLGGQTLFDERHS